MNVSPTVLTVFIKELFVAAKLPDADARLCAEVHVLQEMRGVTTHGLRHVLINLDGLIGGQINPLPNRTVLRDEAATIVLDGDQGLGIVGCMDAMHRTIAKSRQFGIGIGIVIHSNHFLSAAPYCLRATEHDMIGICFSNTWASMGYPGTNVRVIANSPLGFGIPSAAGFSIIFDSALTTSGGRLSQWIRENKTIPAALWGINKEGNPSSDPTAVLHGGTPWPIGGHKGAGLAVLVEILTGVLGGGGFLHGIQAPSLRTSKGESESQCCIVIDIARIMPVAEFRERMVAFIDDLKNNPLAPGYTEILVPGERAHRTQLRCLRDGVTLEADVALDLRTWAQMLNVAFPF
ncbi:MAG: Ldh family oxidoreductase [Acidobacteriaceae bacterium]